MNSSVYHTFLLLCALAALGLFSGCNGNGASEETEQSPYFPEIENMSLIVMDSAVREGLELEKSIFFMDRYEVTNRGFASFMEASRYEPSHPEVFLEHWDAPSDNGNTSVNNGSAPGSMILDHPVVFVNYEDACAYAEHFGKALPTKEQWLWAAIGWVGNKHYPWGDQFMNFYCNSWRSGIRGLSKVGTFEYGKSEWGCYDMVGNASEWCATRAEDRIEEMYYVLGGSWSHGGTPQEEEAAFNLLEQAETAEAASRNNQLGFRCVKNDALDYIRKTLVPRIAGLGYTERQQAADELSDMLDPLYSVLKLLEFEAAISRPLTTHPSLSLICSQEGMGLGQSAFLMCHDDGFIRSLGLDGSEIWKHEKSEENAPYRFKTVSNRLGPDDKIIAYSWLNSLLAVFDAGTGREQWRDGRGGLAHHVQIVPSVPGNDAGSRLLVVWHTDDRYEAMNRHLSPLLDEIDERIRAYASVFLTREALASPKRIERLSLFVENPGVREIDDESRFAMNRFNELELYMDGSLDQRYWIQLLGGGYFNIDVRTTPACWLTLYDLETGFVHWARDFPGALFDFKGVITREPLVFDDGKRIAVVLRDEKVVNDFDGSLQSFGAGEGPQTGEARLCILNLENGEIEFQYRMEEPDDRVTTLAALVTRSSDLAKIAGARELVLLKKNLDSGGGVRGEPEKPESENGAPESEASTKERPEKGLQKSGWILERRTLRDLLSTVNEWIRIDETGEPSRISDWKAELPWVGSSEESTMDEPDFLKPDPPGLHDFWSPCAPLSPWLVTEPDADNGRLLLNHKAGNPNGEGAFNQAFIVGGAFNRSVCLSDETGDRLASYMLVWDSSGNMLCFDAQASRYLWRLELGAITDLMKPVMTDLNRDGLFEAAIPTLSGEIKIIELDSGNSVLNMMRVGASFTFLIPVEVDGDPVQELLVGIRDRGVFLMNNSAEAEDKEAFDLARAIKALDK